MASINLTSQAYTAMPRKMRRPEHRFHVRHKPFQIQPVAIAPVLPGETLKTAMIQIRAVTQPIKNPLIGWWYESYLFYVKHRDFLGSRDAATVTMGERLQAMMLDYNATALATNADDTDTNNYSAAGCAPFTKSCLIRVVEEFFRDEEEAYDVAVFNGVPLARTGHNSVLQSVITETNFPDGVDFDTPAGTVDTPLEMDEAYRAWYFMTQQAMTKMTYEDFLKTYGIRGAAAQEPHRPELIRYVRDWTYPTNTIDPTNGVPRSAASWAIRERADKDRFFTEPGFLFGVVVCRPKVYYSNLFGSAAELLVKGRHWLPAIAHEDDFISIEHYAADAGIIVDSGTDGYALDLRDLFIYGDQFVGGDELTVAATDINCINRPNTSTLESRYPSNSAAASDILFVDQDDADQYVAADGVFSFMIAGRQEDRTK